MAAAWRRRNPGIFFMFIGITLPPFRGGDAVLFGNIICKALALERREYLGQTVGKVGVSAAFKGNSEL